MSERHPTSDAASRKPKLPLPPVPSPETRIPPDLYCEVRDWLLANDDDGPKMMHWSNTVKPPVDAENMAAEIIWIILCAGRSAQAARTIERKVRAAIDAGEPVATAFGYRAKAAAIERAWRWRTEDFAALQEVLKLNDPAKLLEWCYAIPFIGDDTKYQLAKNFGGQCCKPDIWMCRLVGIPDHPRRRVAERYDACMRLCRMLSDATGDKIAAIDSMLWLACNKGFLRTGADAGRLNSWNWRWVTTLSLRARQSNARQRTTSWRRSWMEGSSASSNLCGRRT